MKKLLRVQKSEAAASAIAGEVFSSIRAIFSLGAQKTLTKKYFAAVDESRKYGLAMCLPYGIQLAPMFFVMYASLGLVFWFGIKQFLSGRLANIGTLITYGISSRDTSLY